MYCSNCGRECKDGELFCGGCGVPREKSNQMVQQVTAIQNIVPIQPVVNEKKGLSGGVIVLIVIGVTLLIGVVGIFFLGLIFFNFIENEDDYIYEETSNYVYYDGEEIPSVYDLVGQYELCDVPYYSDYEGESLLTYSYCDDYFDDYVIDEYLNALIEDYGFENYEISSSFRSVIIEANEDGYYLVVKGYIYGEYIEYYKITEELYYGDNSI